MARMKTPRTPEVAAVRFLTEVEACELYHVSREGLKKLRSDPIDPLPHLLVGRRILYDPKTLECWARRRAERRSAAKRRRAVEA